MTTQGLLEGKNTTTRIYTFTKDEAIARQSKVVTGQLQVANSTAYTFFDSGATHSFASYKFVEGIAHARSMLKEGCSKTLPSEEVLLSSHSLQKVPMILAIRKLYAYLVILVM